MASISGRITMRKMSQIASSNTNDNCLGHGIGLFIFGWGIGVLSSTYIYKITNDCNACKDVVNKRIVCDAPYTRRI